jgi:hypothetical protein
MNRMIARLRHRIGHWLAVIAVTVLSGCDDSSEMYCPNEGRAFFESSINAYFERHPPRQGDTVHILPGANYDTTTNWWLVPVDVGPEKLLALLSCDGHLELSDR